MSETDHQYFMQKALDAARPGIGLTGFAPCIGCVIVRDGEIIATGRTQNGGVPHAEDDALVKLQKQDISPAGATVYVTLEPCATPDLGAGECCADLLIEAGVANVHMAVLDPDYKTNGQGKRRMEEAGINTSIGLCAEQAYRQNPWFYEARGVTVPV